jgi:hypothetical protein
VLLPGFHPVLDATFGSEQSGWLHNPPLAGWADGAYRLSAVRPTRFVAVGAPLADAFGPVVVTATFRKVSGPPGGGYGLIVRDQGPGPRDGDNQSGSYYVAEVGDRGEIGLWRRDGDRWIDLVPWTPSTAVRQGGSSNTLLVQANGDQLTFIVNGIPVAAHTDGTLPAGQVGFFVGGDGNEVALDHFAVGVPD